MHAHRSYYLLCACTSVKIPALSFSGFWFFSAEREYFYVTLILRRISAVHTNHTHTHVACLYYLFIISLPMYTAPVFNWTRFALYLDPHLFFFPHWNEIIKSWTKSRKRSVPSFKVRSVSRFTPLWRLQFVVRSIDQGWTNFEIRLFIFKLSMKQVLCG